MKKRMLTLIAALILLGSLSAPVIAKADGGPNPNCTGGQMCKP
jgi:hypothetical protein